MTILAAQVSDKAARRAAQRIGLLARKSRWRKYSIDNYGDFMVFDPYTNSCVAGPRFDMTATDVVEYCRSQG